MITRPYTAAKIKDYVTANVNVPAAPPSAQQVAIKYSSTMDSVNLINRIKAKDVLTDEDVRALDRHIDQVKSMLAKDFWTTENMAPLLEVAEIGVPDEQTAARL